MDSFEHQQVLDDEHLRLLRIGYLVMGGLSVFMSIFGVFYALMGALIVATIPSTQTAPGQPSPTFIAWFFAAFGLIFVIFAGAYAALSFLTARNLRLRRSRTICLVTAGMSCLHIPFGTLIGVFTFSVLGRPSVQRLFGQGSPASMQPPLPTPPPSPPSVGTVA